MSYVSLESCILHVESEITWDNTIPFLATLREMDTRDDCDVITVHISSLGGSGLAAVAISQALQTCRKPIHTIGTGYVASSAVTILAAGTRGQRKLVDGTLLMLHEATLPNDTDHTKGMAVSALAGYAQEMAIRVAQHHEELARLTGKPADFWREHLKGRSDWLIQSDEALRLGLADDIIKRSCAPR